MSLRGGLREVLVTRPMTDQERERVYQNLQQEKLARRMAEMQEAELTENSRFKRLEVRGDE